MTSNFDRDQFNYIEHLQLDTLLTSQNLVSDHPEEMLFVIIHQVYELWFKQLIHDARRVIAHLDNDELPQTVWLLQRMARILKVADTQLGVLEMLSFMDFQAFRPSLYQSSGLQSRQFRTFELLGGLAETAGEPYRHWVESLWPGLIGEEYQSMHASVEALLRRAGHDAASIYAQRWVQAELHALLEACLDVDRGMVTWRHNHIQMVRRMIGGKAQGTGGTFVERYLEPTTRYRFFPELWDVRNETTARSGGTIAS
jgi:tryptophan 2,3-dioxygenase